VVTELDDAASQMVPSWAAHNVNDGEADQMGKRITLCEDVVGRGSEQYLLGRLSTIA